MARVHEQLEECTVSPPALARALSRLGVGGLIFFDSSPASISSQRRFSIISCEPERVLTGQGDSFVERPTDRRVSDPVNWLLEAEEGLPTPVTDLPFEGGLAGMIGFEFAWQLDHVHAVRGSADTPDIWVGCYPAAMVFDHVADCWYVAGERDSRTYEMLSRAREESWLQVDDAPGAASGETDQAQLSVTSEMYRQRVQACIDAIYAGELFEVNYTERFFAEFEGDGWELYERLYEHSDSGYGGYLEGDAFELASMSPEQFLAVDRGRVVTRPIKGTRGRGDTPEEDARLAEELLASEKDRAENVMIVDLMRNDLTRVCRPGSVSATEICELESFAGVHHLVSTVEGQLADFATPMSVLLAAFPPGSITGAPKLRSIELIAETEETPRGPYTGTLFYESPGGRLDSSVLIRTAILTDGRASYGTGGAVVADSEPDAEYREALVKASPFIEAIES